MKFSVLKRRVEKLAPESNEPIIIEITRTIVGGGAREDDTPPPIISKETSTIVIDPAERQRWSRR